MSGEESDAASPQEEEIRADVREQIRMWADRMEENGTLPEGVENGEAWVAHVITSEANKYRRDGI